MSYASLNSSRPLDVRDEILYQSDLTRVFRRHGTGGTGSVICKEFLGPNAMQRLRHERRILERLALVEGVPRLVHAANLPCAIAMEDSGALPLTESVTAGDLEITALLELALQLTGILAALHRTGVAHRNLTPANLMCSGPKPRVLLIDFSLATTFAEERPGFVHHREIAGELPYLAPEQTGRTGWPVDQRADLYALGATLYQLATGRLPFEQTDPLQLIHDILARVPAAPNLSNPRLPQGLSDIIMRLLEKEPDRRYQSAEGLGHDLTRLVQLPASGASIPFALGQRDFALRLSPPSRLIGRSSEIAALRDAFEAASSGKGRGALVAGSPGIGKSTLLNELRPVVTARRGFFVAGKFDQHRHDLESDAVQQAMRALGSLLLAEPEQELVSLRQRLLAALGSNAGLIAAMLPEFALLLAVPSEILAGDPLKEKGRLIRAAIDLLGAVASPTRPLVLVLDDLQWAAPTPISFVDAVLNEGVPGLLLVCAYREAEVDASHPLRAMLARWERSDAPPLLLRLSNLPPADLGLLLEDMLRLKPGEAAKLAEAVAARTGGNPYDTVELVNALRRDGALLPTEAGWSWNATTIRRYVGRGDVVDLLADRIERLPVKARALLEIMACLGGEVEPFLLQCASTLSDAELEEQLAPSLEDGLLVMEQAGGALRFRHDRVQQAAHGRLEPPARRTLHLALARRLAAFPEFESAAAEQYLPAVDAILEPAERHFVAGLFRGAAAKARLINQALAEALLAAAMSLLQLNQTPAEDPLWAATISDRHAALYSLGRLDQADQLYRLIEVSSGEPLQLVDAACVQVNSLTNRGRPREALALGLGLLQQLGFFVPRAEQVEARLHRGLQRFYRWVEEDARELDLERPEMSDPHATAAAKLINRCMPAAFFCDQPLMTWMVLESRRLWEEHGPCPLLVAPLCHAGHVTIARDDYRSGYRVMRRALATGAARGYEAETSQARFLFSLIAVPWFEPLEESVRQAHWAREGVLRGGDLQFAGYTFYAALTALIDCAPTLDPFAAELEAGLAFVERTGNGFTNATLLSFRQLLRSLRGETSGPGSFTDPCFDETSHLEALGSNPMAACNYHLYRALAAALFGDAPSLKQHAASAMPLLPYVEGVYSTALAHLLQALALARQLPGAGERERDDLLARLKICRDWLARRAEDAPDNFLHLLRLVEAEQAWGTGEFRSALSAFDAALGSTPARPGSWHRALIAERAGLFHLAHGLEQSGCNLLAEARQLFDAWGASGKVRQLDQAHPLLRASRSRPQEGETRARVSADSVDLLAVLRASQALSSETGLDRLRVQVVELLGALTGATAVSLVVWQEQAQQWALLGSALAGEPARPVPLEEAGNLLPISVFRFAERTREPLLVEDAKSEDRFRHDPYLAPLEHCSLLAVPILNHGAPRAMLLLENRLSRGAFTADRLDAVTLIAGQLAVSLENALLYEKLEERVQERTLKLQEAQHELVTAARQAGMAEIATNVLHNVGNVLNSVNISAGLVMGRLRDSRAPGLLRAVRLMKEHAPDLGEYLSRDEKGKLLPEYLEKLALALAGEQQEIVAELSRLTRSVDHIKEIVATQQSYAGAASIIEPVQLRDLVQDALRMNLGSLKRHEVTVVQEFAEIPVLPLDKGRLLQILVNLISNAKQAMDALAPEARRMTLRLELTDDSRLRISVSDQGEGITRENLSRIFTHGFTTRSGGHGFGLHSCALAAGEMGGTLTASSQGAGQGASFVLEIPVAA